jgi:hypothetical protein
METIGKTLLALATSKVQRNGCDADIRRRRRLPRTMKRRAAATAMGAAVLVATGAASGTVPTSASQSRLVDRTLFCRPAEEGAPDSIRIMRLAANPRSPSLPPNLRVYDRGVGDSIIGAELSTGPEAPGSRGSLSLRLTPRCSTSRLRVALSHKGLARVTARVLADHTCNVPAAVLIRIRAVFKRPTELVTDPSSPLLFARGTIATGHLAITAVRGRKPIALASVTHRTGTARLFLDSRRCYGD